MSLFPNFILMDIWHMVFISYFFQKSEVMTLMDMYSYIMRGEQLSDCCYL